MEVKGHKNVRVVDIIEVMEGVAPSRLAEEWDNCGLQVGHLHWAVDKIWIALDPLPSVIQAAVQNRVDLVISHHPLIFKPLKSIDLETVVGQTIETALKNKTAIYAAHTNLDSAQGGINDLLARKIGLTDLTSLMPPPAYNGENTAGGSDDHTIGLGRIGRLDKPLRLEKLALQIKAGLNLKGVKVAGKLKEKVSSVAVCSGSGGGLLNAFLSSGAEVFVTGDLKYHDAIMVENAGRALIDVGHFASEHLIVDPLAQRLASVMQSRGWPIKIEACPLERDPFEQI